MLSPLPLLLTPSEGLHKVSRTSALINGACSHVPLALGRKGRALGLMELEAAPADLEPALSDSPATEAAAATALAASEADSSVVATRWEE